MAYATTPQASLFLSSVEADCIASVLLSGWFKTALPPIQLQSAVQMVALVSPMAATVCVLLDTQDGTVLRSCVSPHEVNM